MRHIWQSISFEQNKLKVSPFLPDTSIHIKRESVTDAVFLYSVLILKSVFATFTPILICDLFLSFSSCPRRYVYKDTSWTCSCYCSYFSPENSLYHTNIYTVWIRGTEGRYRAPSCDRTAFVSFPSTLAEAKCTWRKTSSCTAVQQRAQRPSSTCERCATASVFPLENTSLSPPPLSPTRMQTSICGCSLRNRLISSMFLPLISATL